MSDSRVRHGIASLHGCHVPGCPTAVPPRLLMCRPHWMAVPIPLRDAVQAAYRRGQETGKVRPTMAYLEAARAAIAAVKSQEASR